MANDLRLSCPAATANDVSATSGTLASCDQFVSVKVTTAAHWVTDTEDETLAGFAADVRVRTSSLPVAVPLIDWIL